MRMQAVVFSVVITVFCWPVLSIPGFSQSTQPQANGAQGYASGIDEGNGSVGAGVKVSTFGAGAEVAVRVTHRTNVRAGFNIIMYSRGFDKDGIHYDGQLNFKTFEAHYDVFPWAKSFHVSGGILVYAADPITATSTVPGNQAFSLGGVDFVSDPTNPVSGSGKMVFRRAAPTITFGFGNLVRRGESSHFSIPIEVGVAFQGAPKTTLALAGNVCDSSRVNCRSVASDPTVQSQIISEQNKINSDMSFFKVYPILSVGLGYKF